MVTRVPPKRATAVGDRGPAADRGKRRRLWNNRPVLTGFVFDEQQSEQVEDWRAAIERLNRGQLLWLALHDPTEQEVAAVRETLDLGEALAHRLGEHPRSASVADEGERMYVTLYVVNSGGDVPELVPIECVLGVNWIVTAYRERADVLEEFFERVQGGGQVGALDAPSFVATPRCSPSPWSYSHSPASATGSRSDGPAVCRRGPAGRVRPLDRRGHRRAGAAVREGRTAAAHVLGVSCICMYMLWW